MKNNVDPKQYIHLDNPFNREKPRETLRQFRSMPKLQQRNAHYGGPKRTLHGEFYTQPVNSSSQGHKLVAFSIAGEAGVTGGTDQTSGGCSLF